MRIAQIAPLAESVPPKLYGGTERVVAWLIEELIELGHEVTLFASGDSKTRANLVPVWPRALRLGRPRSDPLAAQTALLEAVAAEAADFDIIHSHVDWLHLPLLSRLGVPFVTTPHGRLDLPGLSGLIRRFPNAPFISISENQRTDPLAAQTALLEAVAAKAADFDIIHSHIDRLHLPLLSRLGVPFVTTPHGRLDLPGLPAVIRRFPNAPFISISENQRTPLPEANWLGTVYHGMPVDTLRPSLKPGSYVA